MMVTLSMRFAIITAFAFATLNAIVKAHSHHFTGEALQAYRRNYALRHRSLSLRCGAKLQARRLRRSIALMEHRDVGHTLPDSAGQLLYEHYMKRANTSNSSSSNNASACLLTPEVTQGPYHVLGELVRQNITSGQDGLPLHLMIDFVDVNTCEPLTDAWVDVWQANATGHYSGFGTAGSGGGADSMSIAGTPSGSVTAAPSMTGSMGGGGMSIVNASTIDNYTAGADSSGNTGMSNNPTDGDHFLRGVWQTDSDGILSMYTYVPGWYEGRAPHIHLKVYEGSSGYKADNGTFIANGTLAHHTGQWFVPVDVMNKVAVLMPYSENALAWANATKNDEDSIYPYADSMGTEADLEISFVNQSDISYGLIGTTTVGINMTYASAELTTAYWDPNLDSATNITTTTSASQTSISSSLSDAGSTSTP